MANSILERIKEYIDFKGISVSAFEKSMSFSNGSFGSQLKNKKAIGVDRLENILKKYPDINTEWLLTGQGDMLKGENIAKKQIYKGIPLIPTSILASKNSNGVQILESDIEDYFIIPFLREKADFVCQIDGHSMLPTYEDKTYLVCRHIGRSEFNYERAYVITVNHSPMVKRLVPSVNKGNVICRSDNPVHRDFEVPLTEITSIYKIIASIRMEAPDAEIIRIKK